MISYKQICSAYSQSKTLYPMAPLNVKTKDLPAVLRKKVGLAITDTVTVRFEKGRITLTPLSELDRHIAQGLEDIRKGRTYGPFDTAEKMVSFLKKQSKRKTKRA